MSPRPNTFKLKLLSKQLQKMLFTTIVTKLLLIFNFFCQFMLQVNDKTKRFSRKTAATREAINLRRKNSINTVALTETRSRLRNYRSDFKARTRKLSNEEKMRKMREVSSREQRTQATNDLEFAGERNVLFMFATCY